MHEMLLFHHSIIPVWNMQNAWLGIPYYQQFVEIPIHTATWGTSIFSQSQQQPYFFKFFLLNLNLNLTLMCPLTTHLVYAIVHVCGARPIFPCHGFTQIIADFHIAACGRSQKIFSHEVTQSDTKKKNHLISS
jgi:hypothetical protein